MVSSACCVAFRPFNLQCLTAWQTKMTESSIETRECGACGKVVDHLLVDGDILCCGCGATDESVELGDCDLRECPDDATHLVVYNPVGGERYPERYCEIHAEMAAEDAREEDAEDLFYGPAEIE